MITWVLTHCLLWKTLVCALVYKLWVDKAICAAGECPGADLVFTEAVIALQLCFETRSGLLLSLISRDIFGLCSYSFCPLASFTPHHFLVLSQPKERELTPGLRASFLDLHFEPPPTS